MTSKLLLTAATAIALAAAPIHGSQAQDRSPISVVSEIELPDLASVKAYVDNITTLVASMGGRFVLKSGNDRLDRSPMAATRAATPEQNWSINE